MANLKEIRVRISSVRSTRQITSAMKMVSAAKLRKAQDAIIQMRPYADKLKDILNHLISSLENREINNVYNNVRPVNKVLLVVIASNKGLCGAFNSNVFKRVNNIIGEKYSSQLEEKNLNFIAIGRKAEDFLKSKKYPIVNSYNNLLDNLTYENALPVITRIMKDFAEKKYDKIELIYNQFKNTAVQILTTEEFLPVINHPQPDYEEEKPGREHHTDYILEPSKKEIINELIPKTLKIQFFKSLLDSNASEHGARMTAMHKATDNATELLKDLQLQYNKARQSSITNEILEIVSGAEALKS